MKQSLVLILLLSLTCIPLYGQNQASVNQSNKNNEVNITQVAQPFASADGNVAEVTQNGYANKIWDLHQLGSGNRFMVTQRGENNRLSDVTDQGGADGLPVPSHDGTIEIKQIGNNNYIDDADQVGTGNELYINQGLEGSPGSNNYVMVEAQVSIGGTGNYVHITQTGDHNHIGDPNSQRGIFQQGSDNRMTITQSGGASAGKQSETIPPSGDFDNRFFKSEYGGHSLIQLGTGNKLTINQSGESSVDKVYQNGRGNLAEIVQTGATNAAAVSQTGTDNIADIIQHGSGNSATITQR